jgi:RNA polymerase sigma factor (TIGR02999 family)
MGPEPSLEVTQLLRAWSGGDLRALDQLIPLVYQELHRMARVSMRHENPGATLQPTAIINEAFLRLAGVTGVSWQDRAHFFAVSAQIMRRILVDAARARGSDKRGGGALKLNLNESVDAVSDRGRELIDLDDALESLAKLDPRKARVVELRFFGGLSVEETAEALKVSPQTVLRDWRLARSWLMREMAGAPHGAPRG